MRGLGSFAWDGAQARLCAGRCLKPAAAAAALAADFRPAFLELAELRALLPGLPTIALTATATPAVRSSIAQSLGLHAPLVLCALKTRKLAPSGFS